MKGSDEATKKSQEEKKTTETKAGKTAEEKRQEREEKLIPNIAQNYRSLERSLVEQLYMKQDLHGTTVGSQREDIWKSLFEQILPRKFVLEQSVFILDSNGKVSKEVDLVIMDEMYTPYIFRYGRLKFVPVEAVAAAVECKSKSSKKGVLEEWSKSIEELKTSKNSIARIATCIAVGAVKTQQATRPIRIFCALKETIPDNVESFFDFVLLATQGENTAGAELSSTPEEVGIEGKEETTSAKKYADKKPHIEIRANSKYKNLYHWYKSLNFCEEPDKLKEEEVKKSEGAAATADDAKAAKVVEAAEALAKAAEEIAQATVGRDANAAKEADGTREAKGKEGLPQGEAILKGRSLDAYQIKDENGQGMLSLLSFNFQLNQLLMLINNPMLFPHLDYVTLFNRKLNGGEIPCNIED